MEVEMLLHPLSHPSAPGICPEMLEVAAEANRAGDYNLAAEIYSSQLADLQQPDRGLCLRKADTLVRAGRLSEALDSYCTAASLGKLRPEELPLLVESIARGLREKEPGLRRTTGGEEGEDADGESPEDDPLDLFSCGLCRCVLHEPSTVECGHTFCRRCLEPDSVKDCVHCKRALARKEGLPNGRRLNVVLGGLLDKLFATETRARRLWIEGEELWQSRNLAEALEKYNDAVELAPSSGRLLCQRAELHMDMDNVSQAVRDASSLCQIKPRWPKAHYLKATTLSKAARNDEALEEYFLCVALKPDWTKVRVEAQKVLAELFSSVFENQDMPTPLHPLQGGVASRPIKPPALLRTLRPLAQKPSLSTQEFDLSMTKSTVTEESSSRQRDSIAPPGEGSGTSASKSLADVLASLPTPPTGFKRKQNDECSSNPPTKILKPGEASDVKTAAAYRGRVVPSELLDSGDLECSLCMRLFYEPVATPCGHTFCLKCLERCLDHNPNCPLCKENLSEFLATRGYNKTLLMEEILQRYLATELAERKKVHEEEMKELSNLNQEVPIFVCTMAFPTIPCPLHVFEPRYRLMIRRSMETGTKQFGMCIADELKGFADYGCMLQVQDVKFFPDGRSVVETIGVSRFKVLSHGQRDGYHTAKIEYLEDKKVEGEELVQLLKLHDAVYEQASNWFTSLKDNMKTQIVGHFGQLPGKDPDPQASSSGPAWCWWLLAVLPLENRAQLTILSMSSLKERLLAIRKVLIFVMRRRPR
ncbi:LON peptidase N-terminal domain and RING finger protein 2 [Corythoichthys intestinalis]|uniref:LON peptidase N-terminal domain and RING finger protein 2 n=1 Tax=Corythoichthys intestinalis TaxID=161448 RepID=UPI0025A4E23B|nr:LON peptidase N-terminal domain and RING finger protein 2-like [Corythoichthys intestinalis]XP_061799577.1 LON peptidase N-terminal domain and RING finger protein 2-like [Nerophis lumbriciformis]